jgi:hypothetical protein
VGGDGLLQTRAVGESWLAGRAREGVKVLWFGWRCRCSLSFRGLERRMERATPGGPVIGGVQRGPTGRMARYRRLRDENR